MGAIDNFLKGLKMNTDVDDYGDYDYDEVDVVDEEPSSSRAFEDRPKKSNKVTSFSQKKKSLNNGMEIMSFKPESYEDSSKITNELLNGNSVIINVSNVDIAIARQILDFTAGSIYALKGTLKKITDSIFVAVPHGVNIDGAFADKNEE